MIEYWKLPHSRESIISSIPAENICSKRAYLGTLSRIVPIFLISYGSTTFTKRKNFAYFSSSQQLNNCSKVNPLNWLDRFFTGFPLNPIDCLFAKSYFTVRPSS